MNITTLSATAALALPLMIATGKSATPAEGEDTSPTQPREPGSFMVALEGQSTDIGVISSKVQKARLGAVVEFGICMLADFLRIGSCVALIRAKS